MPWDLPKKMFTLSAAFYYAYAAMQCICARIIHMTKVTQIVLFDIYGNMHKFKMDFFVTRSYLTGTYLLRRMPTFLLR